jgi:hypothetical protein
MEPGCWNGIDLEGAQGHGTKYPIEVCRKQGIEDLAQPVIIQGRPLQPRLEKTQHPTLLKARPDLVKGMMAIKNREE